jgi:hypothetical protein
VVTDDFLVFLTGFVRELIATNGADVIPEYCRANNQTRTFFFDDFVRHFVSPLDKIFGFAETENQNFYNDSYCDYREHNKLLS